MRTLVYVAYVIIGTERWNVERDASRSMRAVDHDSFDPVLQRRRVGYGRERGVSGVSNVRLTRVSPAQTYLFQDRNHALNRDHDGGCGNDVVDNGEGNGFSAGL